MGADRTAAVRNAPVVGGMGQGSGATGLSFSCGVRPLPGMPDPILLSTWHFGLPANKAGWPQMLKAGGLLDGLEQTCVACELDPAVDSVGVGGLPDASGDVSLDGAVMLSPARSAGVAYVRRYAHPVSIARRVMERTPHKLLVGAGAERFAASQGYEEAVLLTENARRKWEEWKLTGAYRDFHIGETDATH